MKTDNDLLTMIKEDIHEIKNILARQEESLKLHIYRTELAEENIELLRKDLKPVKRHVDFINSLGKIALILAAVLTAAKKIGLF